MGDPLDVSLLVDLEPLPLTSGPGELVLNSNLTCDPSEIDTNPLIQIDSPLANFPCEIELCRMDVCNLSDEKVKPLDRWAIDGKDIKHSLLIYNIDLFQTLKTYCN